MGTRGICGFVIDGQVKASYQQYDSYPSGVGAEVVAAILSGEIDADKVRAIKLVNEDDKPTAEEVEQLRQFADTGVSTGQLTEWYVLLRKNHGDVLGHQSAGVMIDSHEFAGDSLFCEWAYLVNLDTNTLEVYRGFVQEPEKSVGRFAELEPYRPTYTDTVYNPITLIREFPFSELTEDTMTSLEKELYPDDE